MTQRPPPTSIEEKSILVPHIFEQFPEIVAAQSTRVGGAHDGPFGMNLSSNVGDDAERVESNRKDFFRRAGVSDPATVVYQHQTHSVNVNYADGTLRIIPNSDALWTDRENIFLAISVADCTPILLYDPCRKVIAGVHAGWRGTEQHILQSILKLFIQHGSKPEAIHAFIGASASAERYEVGPEVATLFEKKHVREKGDGKFLLDVKGANLEQLLRSGVPETQIEVSPHCTIGEEWLQSYRRDGAASGRMLAIIGRVA